MKQQPDIIALLPILAGFECSRHKQEKQEKDDLALLPDPAAHIINNTQQQPAATHTTPLAFSPRSWAGNPPVPPTLLLFAPSPVPPRVHSQLQCAHALVAQPRPFPPVAA